MSNRTLKSFLFVLILCCLFLSSPLPALAATIVIDPGHSACKKAEDCKKEKESFIKDPKTNKGKIFIDQESNNGAENQEVWDVAEELRKKLEAAGHKVIMTKKSAANDTVSLWERADIANQAKANLAISIHNDHKQSWSWAEIYEQRMDSWREHKDGSKAEFNKKNGAEALANKSHACAKIFETERNAAEGREKGKELITVNTSFMDRPLAKGNIPWVQLLSNVPWVYHEVGAKGGMTADQKKKYTEGLFNGITKALAEKKCVGDGAKESTAPSDVSFNVKCVITKVGNPTKPSPTFPPECIGGAGGGGPMAQKAIELARKQVEEKKMYGWGDPSRNWASNDPNKGKTPSTFDCSGLLGWVWYWSSGGKVKMAGQTGSDWNKKDGSYQKFKSSDISQIQPGDLIYFGTPDENSRDNPSHVGMWVGNGKCGANDCIIHTYETGKPAEEISLAERNKHSKKSVTGFLRPVIK